MANGQYSIPGTLAEPEQPAVFSSQFDVLQYTPESQPAAYGAVYDMLTQFETQPPTPEVKQSVFSSFKPMSERLVSYRNTAIAMEEKKQPWLKAAKALIITPKPILAELIEEESVILGKLVQKESPDQENRVWVLEGDLFYGFSAKDKKKNISLDQTTVRYLFNEEYVTKLFFGKSVPFVNGELENLAQLIPLIEPTLLHELYTVDEALEELKKEDFRLAA
jgi:hypothetical protein